MSQAVTLAKAAREKLAAALNALQSEAEVPEALLEVAEPIAQAMSVLHRVERSQGADLEGRDKALDAVRRALDMLQKIEQSSSAVDLCLEAVAASLAKVHALTKVPAAAPTPPPQPAPQPAVPRPQPAPSPVSRPLAPVPAPAHLPAPPAPTPQPAWPPAAAIAQPAPAGPAPVVGVGATQHMSTPAAQPPAPAPTEAFPPAAPRMQGGTLMMTPQQAQAEKAAPAPQVVPSPVVAPVPVAAAFVPSAAPVPAPTQPFAQPVPQAAPVHQPVPVAQQHVAQAQPAQAYQPQPVPQPSPAAQRPHPAAQPEAPKPVGPAPAGSVVVELGAHSVSNFYKGLSGNDVIEHGGIFVGTYKIPKLGTSVSLRVLLPGDYEFHASGTVQWVREAGDGVEPGFGAKFTQITPEGRQLVYRYARNREPIFYDDL